MSDEKPFKRDLKKVLAIGLVDGQQLPSTDDYKPQQAPELPTDYKCEFEHPRQHRQRPEGLSGSVLEAWRTWTFDYRNPEFFEDNNK